MHAVWVPCLTVAAAVAILALGKYRVSGDLVFSGGSVSGRVRIRSWWNILAAEWDSGGGGRMSVYLAQKRILLRERHEGAKGLRAEGRFRRTSKRSNVRSLARAIGYLKKTVGHIRVRTASCRLVFGTGDPCETGVVWGWFHAIRGLLPETASVSVAPDFIRKRFEGNVHMVVEFTMALLIARTLWCAVRTAFNE